MNRLRDQTSPYLQQHANDPVDWQPWDDEALALARRENKPILLSIGYSASHLCHVMARESFQSTQIAILMNQRFVNIMIDREERPDLDRIYQTAHGLLNRRAGGWPLTMMLDPNDHLPFFGGTYFPPQSRPHVPSFRDVLKGIATMYGSKNDRMPEFKATLRDALTQVLGGSAPAALDITLIERACGQIDSSFDAQRGGFSEAPKFPHPAGLELLLEVAQCAGEEAKTNRALHMLDFTLCAMSRGGLFDHVGGGFFHDSIDADWTIPHFEKMLYDNALLLSVYARRAGQTKNLWFAAVADQIADWMMREMQLGDGSMCGSLDADVDGTEGRFYAWSYDELRSVLGGSYAAVAERFGLNNKANFDGTWHLRLAPPEPASALSTENPVADLTPARALLFSARETRVRPARDDKILTSWNALSARGLADIGHHLGRADCFAAATRVVDYLQQTHWHDGRLVAASRAGKARLKAYLDDYAFLLDALLVLLAARWRRSDLAFAIALADVLLAHFADHHNGGFFFTADDHETLLQRAKSFDDNPFLSGNAMAVRSLLELGFLLGEPRYVDAAERALRAGMTEAGRWPSAHATLMRALLEYTTPPERVVLRCDDDADAAPWRALATERLSPRARCYIMPRAEQVTPALAAHHPAVGDAVVTAYVYRGTQCSAAACSLAEFAHALCA